MAGLTYSSLIQEDAAALFELEKGQKQARIRDRIFFLRLLKEGRATTQQKAGELVGLKLRQSQLLWKQYRRQGLASLLRTHYKGSRPKLDSQQQERLLERLDQDDCTTQKQIGRWVAAEIGVRYSQPGLCLLLARLKAKLKTGRPVHVHKDEAGEEAFKKTFRS